MGKPSKPVFNVFVLCDEAAALLRQAGFEHRYTSRRSEAVYFGLPGRKALLRVARHGGNSGRQPIAGRTDEPVVARVTFRGSYVDGPDEMRISAEKVEQMIAQAIGQYMLKSGSSAAVELNGRALRSDFPTVPA